MRWALGFAVWAVAVDLVTGNPKVRRMGISLIEEVVVTLAAGPFIGAMVALVQPRLTTRLRAALAGTLIFALVVGPFSVIYFPGLRVIDYVIGTALSAIFLGGGYGALLWRDYG